MAFFLAGVEEGIYDDARRCLGGAGAQKAGWLPTGVAARATAGLGETGTPSITPSSITTGRCGPKEGVKACFSVILNNQGLGLFNRF